MDVELVWWKTVLLYGVIAKVPASPRKVETIAVIIFVFLIWSLLFYFGFTSWKKKEPVTEAADIDELALQQTVEMGITVNSHGGTMKTLPGQSPRNRGYSFRWWEELGHDRLWDINSSSANIIVNMSSINTTDHDRMTIAFFVVDFAGRRKTKGGDLILARVTSADNSSNCFAVADIVDHSDGSYTVDIPMLWTGSSIVTLILSQPTELTNMIIRNAGRLQSLWDIEAEFDNKYDKEVTLCGLNPDALWSTSKEICNLTAENDNMEWYCAHPKNAFIKCRHWSGIRSGRPRILSFTADEERLFNRYYSSTPPSVSINVNLTKGNETSAIGERSCFNRPREETWSEKVPISYEQDGMWKLVGCRNKIRTKQQYETCLRGKTVILHGDYSLKQFFDVLIGLLGCTYNYTVLSTEPVSSSVSCQMGNITIYWHPTEMPMYVGHSWSNRTNNRPLYVYLDQLTGDGSDVIVVVHHYTHFLTFPHNFYRQRMRRLSRDLEAALDRLTKLTIVVKGPHYYRLNPLYRNSVFGLAYDTILKEELRRLRDKIIYLNVWDINFNSKDAAYFPEEIVVQRMIEQLMSYVCAN